MKKQETESQFSLFLKTSLSIYKRTYSIRVKKSIKSADEALLQYVNSASGGHGESADDQEGN